MFSCYKIYNQLVYCSKKESKQSFLNYVVTYYFYNIILFFTENNVLSTRDDNIDDIINDIVNAILLRPKKCFVFLCLIEKFNYSLDEIHISLTNFYTGIQTWLKDNEQVSASL